MQRSEPIILPAISRLDSTKVLSGNFRLNLVNINNAITTMEKPRISANQESGPAFSLTVRGSVINPTSNIAKTLEQYTDGMKFYHYHLLATNLSSSGLLLVLSLGNLFAPF